MFTENQRFWKMGVKSEQKAFKNDVKSELWALGGSIFVIWGGFLKRQIFDDFSIGKKTRQNPTFGARGAAKGILGRRVGGRGGVRGA